MKNKLVLKTADLYNLDCNHNISFDIDGEFFKSYGNIDFEDSRFNVAVTSQLVDSSIILDVKIIGEVNVDCDRCCMPLLVPMEIKENILILKEDDNTEVQDEDLVIFISEGTTVVDISDMVYDFIVLNLPMQNIHPDDENGNSTCDARQLQILEKYLKKDIIDPRWEDLKKIKFN
ncbi:MAG: YceD family protein [Bacteroidales bacterium]|jgi:uncharacterized protein